MPMTSRQRGWPVEKVGDSWIYSHTGISTNKDLPCPVCLRNANGIENPDPCLGHLPGVKFACCGHGDPSRAYIMFENGVLIRNFTVERPVYDIEIT